MPRKFINHQAERGVALIQEFSGLLTRDEDQIQFLLQVVHEHRKAFPDSNKKTLTGKAVNWQLLDVFETML